jgi:exportin-5
MEPVRNAWQNADFRDMSASFTGFCELLGLEKVGPYMQSKQAANIEEWTSIPLDDLGKDIQEQLTKRFQVC